ncbi:hypothetical protein Patl1_33743 [Pistacia atlantica]|uniref:Uncharacterized protein n=1 Tax=Pistacia atlantica TaxID=434234 RepID=A0ACC0ZT97_9ROSI|nr:hypothetical protein Patl1_33743 [Pistacia atlantica]
MMLSVMVEDSSGANINFASCCRKTCRSGVRQVNVSTSLSNNYCIEVVLRCLAVQGDGLGSHDLNDGGILGTVMAAGFKGKEYY